MAHVRMSLRLSRFDGDEAYILIAPTINRYVFSFSHEYWRGEKVIDHHREFGTQKEMLLHYTKTLNELIQNDFEVISQGDNNV